jgi:hypothetical protein
MIRSTIGHFLMPICHKRNAITGIQTILEIKTHVAI